MILPYDTGTNTVWAAEPYNKSRKLTLPVLWIRQVMRQPFDSIENSNVSGLRKDLKGVIDQNMLVWHQCVTNWPVCSPPRNTMIVGRQCLIHAKRRRNNEMSKNSVAGEWRKFTDLSKPVFSHITVYHTPHRDVRFYAPNKINTLTHSVTHSVWFWLALFCTAEFLVLLLYCIVAHAFVIPRIFTSIYRAWRSRHSKNMKTRTRTRHSYRSTLWYVNLLRSATQTRE